MGIPQPFSNLRLPVIAAPMFLVSGVELVTAVCRAGMIGTFPSLNQRSSAGYAEWLCELHDNLAGDPAAAAFGVNHVMRKSNERLDADLKVTIDNRVPLVITSLGANREIVDAVHAYGGLVFHDVINIRHARKAAEAGVDGIIAVCAGAGGHAGATSPFALISEIASFFEGTIVAAGAIGTGAHVASARVMGADMAYLGTRFIATQESMAEPAYKQMLLDTYAADIAYTPNISGVNASFLKPSIAASGLDPDNLPPHRALSAAGEAKAWKTLWSAGQGVGSINDLPSAAQLCARLEMEYRHALESAANDPYLARTRRLAAE